MQQNKNIFNKILSSLNRNKKLLLPPFPKKRKRGRVYISSGDITPSLYLTIELLPEEIIIVRERDDIFFCVKLSNNIKLLPDPYCESSITNDLALDYINFYKQFFGYKDYIIKKVRGLFERFQVDGITKTSDDNYIKGTGLYNDLTVLFNKAKDIRVKTVLHKDVQKKLSVREGVVPVLIYKISKDEYNYTSSQLRDGQSINATSNRKNISGLELSKKGGNEVENICQLTLYNTPYARWSVVEGIQLSPMFRFEFYT